jgi:drug/metabolite transporter (DMT)-like permease
MNRMSRPLYLTLVLLFCLAWSSSFPFAKIAVSLEPPLLFLGLRFIIAATLLLGFAGLTGWTKEPAPWRMLMLLGLVNQGCYVGISWLGLGGVSAGFATIIASLNPIMVATLAAPLLGERLHWRKLLGLALGLAGAVYIVRDGLLSGTERPLGVALQLVSLTALIGGTLAYKRFAPEVRLPIAVGFQQLGAGIALGIGGLIFEQPSHMQFVPMFYLVLFWQIFIVSIGAFLLWFFLLSRGTASAASALHFLMPPLGLIMSFIILGEPIRADDLLGIIPIGIGIYLATRAAPEPRAVAPVIAAD